MARAGVAADRSRFAVRTDDQILYHRLVVEGVGIGVLPCVAAERDGLVRLPIPVEASLPVWLAAHRDLRTNAAVRRVADAIRRDLPPLLKSG